MSKKDNKLTSPKRERVSINFLGVDNSSPDISVKDGAMAEMYNVRYNDDAWRPVHMFDKVGEIEDGYRVVYHHPAAGEKVYVITDDSATFYSYDMENDTRTEISTINEAVKDIKHFGNVLIFIGRDNHVEYYVLQDGKYYRFEKPSAPKVELSEGERVSALINYTATNLSSGSISSADEDETNIRYGVWALYDEAGNSIYPTFKDSKWMGEIAFFASYRMKDGSVLSPSPIGISTSEKVVSGFGDYRMQWRKFKRGDDDLYGISLGSNTALEHDAKDFLCPQMHYIAPKITITIPAEISDLVDSVAVFSTRIFSAFEFSTDNSLSVKFADNKLPEQPFYLCKEIRLSDFTNNKYDLDLTYDLLKDVQSNLRYTPSNNIHSTSANVIMEYNNMLHMADIQQRLFPLDLSDCYERGDSELPHTTKAVARLKIDNNTYTTDGVYTYTYNRNGVSFVEGFRSIISYPDYRCDAVHISFVSTLGGLQDHTFAMLSAPQNNVAYYISQNREVAMSYSALHYTSASIPEMRIDNGEEWAVNDVVKEHNKVMVSQTNNPFAFDFANTYSFGSADNNVLAMQSAAVEMSDAKFGEFPLYVFTESGIFGLQSGAESVYSNVVPINYDRIINPRTLAINYNVVYITQKGIHLLNSEGSTLISQPIDTMLGYPDVDKLQRLYPLRSTQYNEISFVVDGIAYIYSLINGVWSTRSFDMHPISQEEAYRYEEIFNIINENATLPARCVIASRPIKLGSVEYKRLETFIPRFANLAETENMTITITIEGSNDCKEWKELRKVDAQGYKVIRRTPQSCKYFRFFLEFTDVEEFTFSNVDLEYYVKFLRRMR